MSNNITIKTLFKKSKKNTDVGTIYLRIKLLWGKEVNELTYSTRENIKPNQFKGGNEPVKGSSQEAIRTNVKVRDYINRIYTLFDEYKVKSNILSKSQFKAILDKEIFNINTGSFDYTTYLCELFPRYFKLQGKKLSNSRKVRYTFIEERIKDFCKFGYGTEKYDVKLLNREFHQEFRNYLYTLYDYSDSTVTGYLKLLDAAVKSAYEDGKIVRYPFEGIKYTYTESDLKYLTKEELDRIKSFKFDNDRLELVADVFTFAAHTGISHCDLYTLCKADLFFEDNKWVAKKRRSKSKVRFTTPLDKTAIAILNKYKDDPACTNSNRILPVLYINEYNECLKRIADKCNIALNLTSHVARHTFATTNWLNKGLAIEGLKFALGHKRIATTERYGKITDLRVHAEANKITEYSYGEDSLYPDKMMINQNYDA